MAKPTLEQLEKLRTEMPEVYEAYLEAIGTRASLWNTLVWYGSDMKKFRGRLLRLAIRLAADAKEGREPDYHTGMDSVIEKMQRDGWLNCQTYR